MFKNTNGAIALTAALITLTAMLITTVSISSLRISRLGNSTDFSNAVSAYNNALALRDEIQADGDVDNFYTPDTTAHCNPTSGNPIWEPNGGYLYCIDDAASVLELRVRANSGAIIQKVALNVQTETFESPLNCAVVPASLQAGFKRLMESNDNWKNEEGTSVGISGNRVITGMPEDSVHWRDRERFGLPIKVDTGSINIYEHTGGDTWERWSLPLNSPLREHQVYIGESSDIYGNYAFAGSPRNRFSGVINQGRVHIFERQGLADWGNEITIQAPAYGGQYDLFGNDIDLECFVAAVSAPGRAFFHGSDPADEEDWHYFSGTVYIFEKLAGVNEWVVREQILPPTPQEFLQFGTSVDLHGDQLIVGAIGSEAEGVSGKAFVYTQITPTDWGVGIELVNPDPEFGDSFGSSVAIDGTNAFVGAGVKNTSEGDESGIVYHYREIAPGNWVLQNTLLPEEVNTSDNFGADIALDGNNLIVGAPGKRFRKGGAFYFEIGGPNWPDFEQEYNNPGRNFRFGSSVAIDGANTVAGAPRTTTLGNGAAYLWELP